MAYFLSLIITLLGDFIGNNYLTTSSPAWGRGLKFDVRTFGAVMTVAPPRVGGVYGYKLSVTGERQAILVNPELYRRDTGLALSDEGGYGLFS